MAHHLRRTSLRPSSGGVRLSTSGRFAFALIAAICGLTALGAPAGASTRIAGSPLPTGIDAGIDVVQVEGLIDPANASLVRNAVRDADGAGSTLLVFQLDSPGAIDVDVADLVRTVREARVPVVVWVGPSGASARGAATMLAAAADVLAVTPGTGLGPASPVSLDRPREWSGDEVVGLIGDLQRESGREAATAATLASERVRADDAVASGVADLSAPTIGELIVSLDGHSVETAAGTVKLSTASNVGEGQERRRRPNQEVRFSELDLGGRVSHTITTPWIAHLVFVGGATLVVFEFFSLGVGVAGLVGAVAIAMAFAGFDHLPVRWWALGLLALGIFGLAVDVQTGRRAFWTVSGSMALLAGSLTLYGGSGRLNPEWWMPLLVCGASGALLIIGIPSMVRARFSLPIVECRGLLGETGAAEGDLDPEGMVRVRGALWRARCRSAAPIQTGTEVRVEAVNGLVLEVAPLADRL